MFCKLYETGYIKLSSCYSIDRSIFSKFNISTLGNIIILDNNFVIFFETQSLNRFNSFNKHVQFVIDSI